MHPILFQSPIFTIHTLWIFLAIAIIASMISLIKLTIKNRLKIQFLSDNSFKIFLFALIGARIFAIIANFHIYFTEISLQTFLQLFKIWDLGLNSWGAIAGIIIFLYIQTKKEDQNLQSWLDILIPSIIIGLAISHIGAFFDGIHYGHETSLPWGVNFENSAVKYAVPIHPTQIYAFLYSAAIATTLIFINNLKKFQETPGLLAATGIVSYSSFYFLEQFLRGDDTIMIWIIRLPQILAAITLLIGIKLLYKILTQNKKPLAKSKKK